MPAIVEASSITVLESFDISGYFKERCRTAVPKHITVAGASSTLNVLVEGEWFRLEARAKDGTPMEVRAHSFFTDAMQGLISSRTMCSKSK